MKLLTSILFLLTLLNVAKGWSPPSSSGSRREFLSKSIAASAGGAAILAGQAFVGVEPSAAAAATPSTADLVQPHSLDDKVMVITGGTTGLGLESAKMLAAGGATVVLTARSETKGEKAIQMVQDYLKQRSIENSKVYSVLLDLDDLESVKTFPQRFQAVLKDKKIDVLMNNAGVMAIPDRQITKDGFERTFQSNHLGHFALTAKLLPFLAEQARVINVSSLAYSIASKGLDLNNLNSEADYGPWKSYGQSKLENILFTQELQRRADAAGRSITATTLHPGAVNTDLARYIIGEQKWQQKKETGPTGFFETAVDKFIGATLKAPQDGAATQVFLASTTDDNEEKGRFYSDLKPQKLPAYATDEKMAKALWERSEELSGVKFSL